MSDDRRVNKRYDWQVRDTASRTKDFYKVSNRRPVNIIACLQSGSILTDQGRKNLIYRALNDPEMGGNDGSTEFSDDCVIISIKKSVHEKALFGDGRSRITTLAHELAHGVMHLGAPKFRAGAASGATSFAKTNALKSAEHQAKVFASAFLGSNSLNPPYKSCGETDRGQVIPSRPVVAGCDASEVLQPVECSFDAPAQLVEALAEAERLLSVTAVGNDRLGSALLQLVAQFSAVVGLVAKHAFRWRHSAEEALRDRAIMCFASGQQNGDEASLSICECVDLRVAPSARAANSLLLLPPFPPAAERCALTCVESIICVSAERPFSASSRNRFSQMPRRAQRTKRL